METTINQTIATLSETKIIIHRRKVSRGQIVSAKRTVQGIEQTIEFDTRLSGKISNRDAIASAKTIWSRSPFYSYSI